MKFAWLPIGTALEPNAASGRVLRTEPGWQLLATNRPDCAVLLLDRDASDAPPWWPAELSALQAALDCDMTTDGARTFCVCQVGSEPGPRTLGDLALRNPSIGPKELCCLLNSIESLCKRQPNAGWETALFIPEAGFLLGTREEPKEGRRGRYCPVVGRCPRPCAHAAAHPGVQPMPHRGRDLPGSDSPRFPAKRSRQHRIGALAGRVRAARTTAFGEDVSRARDRYRTPPR
jgi:hypothetical protein